MAGQFGGWTPIGAEQTATGYEVAWKSHGRRSVFALDHRQQRQLHLDDAALCRVRSIAAIARDQFPSGLEWRRGDWCSSGTVIEAAGSTSLVDVGNQFFLDSISTGSGPSLKYGGADVVAGQFGGWTPIGAEQTATGYEVAWKMPAPISIRSGPPTAAATSFRRSPHVSGTSSTLKSLETSFHQDLNGDGAIGVAGTVIEAAARPAWSKSATNFFLIASALDQAPR